MKKNKSNKENDSSKKDESSQRNINNININDNTYILSNTQKITNLHYPKIIHNQFNNNGEDNYNKNQLLVNNQIINKDIINNIANDNNLIKKDIDTKPKNDNILNKENNSSPTKEESVSNINDINNTNNSNRNNLLNMANNFLNTGKLEKTANTNNNNINNNGNSNINTKENNLQKPPQKYIYNESKSNSEFRTYEKQKENKQNNILSVIGKDIIKKEKYKETESNKYLPSYDSDNKYNSNTESKYILQNKNGLHNLGNTCFMNTCLQILIHTPPFINKLIDYKSTIKPITKSFINLCKELKESRLAVSPSDFKTIYNRKRFQFAGYGQHDTLEFCRYLLDDMSKELNKGNPKAPYKELKTDGKSKLQCNKEYDEYMKTKEDSIITDVFYGELVIEYKCNKCEAPPSYSFQKFLDLPLLFSNSYSEENINNVLQLYFKDEIVDWCIKCPGCKHQTKHLKKVKLCSLPNILVLSLQRFNSTTGAKNSKSVAFSEHIN